jgi:hypothetical protein
MDNELSQKSSFKGVYSLFDPHNRMLLEYICPFFPIINTIQSPPCFPTKEGNAEGKENINMWFYRLVDLLDGLAVTRYQSISGVHESAANNKA